MPSLCPHLEACVGVEWDGAKSQAPSSSRPSGLASSRPLHCPGHRCCARARGGLSLPRAVSASVLRVPREVALSAALFSNKSGWLLLPDMKTGVCGEAHEHICEVRMI